MTSTASPTTPRSSRPPAALTPERGRRTKARIDLIVGATLIVWGLGVFAGAIENGFTLWDDPTYVTQNPLIEELNPSALAHVFTSFNYCNYHPLTYVTYMLEYAVVAHAPWLYHLDNVLLHLVGTLLAYALGKRWLGSMLGAAIVAALFLVHPLRVESVAWVSERKDVLCVVFYLASLLAYTRYTEVEGRGHYLLALFLFVLALLSKVMAITLPAVLVLWHLYRRVPIRWQRCRWQRWVPFASLGVVFAVLGVQAQAEGNAVSGPHGGSWLNHFLSLPKALAFYAAKLIAPFSLSPRYTLEGATGFGDPWVVAGLILITLGIPVVVLTMRRVPLVGFGVGFFFVAWAPVSGIVPSVTFVADRYMYLPAFGLFVAVAALLQEIVKVRVGHPRLAIVAVATGVVVLISWSALSARQVSRWKDNETLWLSALEVDADNEFAHNQLSVTYGSSGRFQRALDHGVAAIRLGLDKPEYLFNLCRAYRGLEEYSKELACAREINRGAPGFLPAWLVPVRQSLERGDAAAAAELLDDLEGRFSSASSLHAARGALLEARGRSSEALTLFLRAYQLNPRDAEVLLGLGIALAHEGEGASALSALVDAVGVPGGIWFPDMSRRLEAALDRLIGQGGNAESVRSVRALAAKRLMLRDCFKTPSWLRPTGAAPGFVAPPP